MTNAEARMTKNAALVIGCWLLAFGLGAVCRAAPDDEEITAEAAAALEQRGRGQVFFADENFDQWVFQGVSNAEQGRLRLQTQANLRLSEINRVCQLSAGQKQKLQLAVRGDMQRFNEEVEEVRRKFDLVKHDQNALGNIWQDIQPLQRKLAAGLMTSDSLLMKTVHGTLNPEQLAAYDAVQDQRRKFSFRAAICLSMVTLENAVSLSSHERDALAKLLLAEAKPPETSGQYDYYLVMYRLAHLPESKVKPLVDAQRWKKLKTQFNQYRGMEAFLIQQGLIAADEVEPNTRAALLLEPAEVKP